MEILNFDHDPSTWFKHGETPKERKKKLAVHTAGRKKHGCSFYDWINFNDYLAALMHHILTQTLNGDITLRDEARIEFVEEALKVAQEVIEKEAELDEKYTVALNRLSGVPWPHAEENHLFTLRNRFLHRFIYDIYPWLPSVEDYTMPVVERPDRMDEQDYPAARDFFSTVVRSGLKKFIKERAGYPGTITDEAWELVLKEMRKGFKGDLLDGVNYGRRSMFVHWFPHLWD